LPFPRRTRTSLAKWDDQQLSIFFPATLLSGILDVAKKMPRIIQKDHRRELSLPVFGSADALVGGLICAMAAAVASLVAGGYPWRVSLPLLFSAVLLVVARVFGSRAGIAGTALAAIIFAMLLFNPLGRIPAADSAARSNLGWMLLIGLGFSLLFAPPTCGFRRH
jgi:hypothetical protein